MSVSSIESPTGPRGPHSAPPAGTCPLDPSPRVPVPITACGDRLTSLDSGQRVSHHVSRLSRCPRPQDGVGPSHPLGRLTPLRCQRGPQPGARERTLRSLQNSSTATRRGCGVVPAQDSSVVHQDALACPWSCGQLHPGPAGLRKEVPHRGLERQAFPSLRLEAGGQRSGVYRVGFPRGCPPAGIHGRPPTWPCSVHASVRVSSSYRTPGPGRQGPPWWPLLTRSPLWRHSSRDSCLLPPEILGVTMSPCEFGGTGSTHDHPKGL